MILLKILLDCSKSNFAILNTVDSLDDDGPG